MKKSSILIGVLVKNKCFSCKNCKGYNTNNPRKSSETPTPSIWCREGRIERVQYVIGFVGLYRDKTKKTMGRNSVAFYSIHFYLLSLMRRSIKHPIHRGLTTVDFLHTKFFKKVDLVETMIYDKVGIFIKLINIHYLIDECMKPLAEIAFPAYILQ